MHSHLCEQVEVLETSNSSLLIQIQELKTKDGHIEELVSGFRKEQDVKNGSMKEELEKGADQISNHEVRILGLETEIHSFHETEKAQVRYVLF